MSREIVCAEHGTSIILPDEQLKQREAIAEYERDLKDHLTNTESGMLTSHHFANGCYAREIFLPKGYEAVGKIHRYDYINIISKGAVFVVTEQGSRLIKAPATWIGKSGVKATAYAVEDTIWTNIHPDYGTRDLREIEKYEIVEDFETLENEWEKGIVPIPEDKIFIPNKDVDGSWVMNEHCKITIEGKVGKQSTIPQIEDYKE